MTTNIIEKINKIHKSYQDYAWGMCEYCGECYPCPQKKLANAISSAEKILEKWDNEICELDLGESEVDTLSSSIEMLENITRKLNREVDDIIERSSK